MYKFKPTARILSLALWSVFLLLGHGTARANTYVYYVTAESLLNSISIADPSFNHSGYFAIFLQPQNIVFSNLTGEAPDLSTDWVTQTNPPLVNDALGLSGDWLMFSRDFGNNTDVNLLSRYNPIVGQSYAGCGPEPYNFDNTCVPGPPPSELPDPITGLLPETTMFRFSFDSPTDPGRPVFNGWAASLTELTSPGGSLKADLTVNFTTSAVPEPGTFLLLASGILIAGARRLRRYRN
jgi:hypothetical protein